jgi:phenylpropionate dioxygenase-like ring-hydroxylating dioxygenase large terminal subunit
MPLKNFWYVSELSSAITNKPKRITMLGQDFVLYRDTKGQVVALSNLCAHCGSALSNGWVEGDFIRCPYHGWKYQSDGTCIEIPANLTATPIPKEARVDAYPVQEKYGWIWLFLGDLPEAERPPLPPLPEFSDTVWQVIHGEFKWNAPYTRVVENGIDISHLTFVHGFERQIIEASDVRLEEWSGSAFVNLRPSPFKGLWKHIRRKDRPDVGAKATFYLPNVTRLDIDFGNSKFILFSVHVPIDDNTTITKWIQFRNFFTHPWANGDARRRILKAFVEDRRVVEAQLPELLPCNLTVPSDVLKIAYRQLRQKWLDMGWGVKQHLIKSDYYGVQAVVIPSPARRQVPELAKAWERKQVSQHQVSHD